MPGALAAMALDRHTVRAFPGVRFAKLLGTGSGDTFTVRDADAHHWAVLVAWETREAAEPFDRSPVIRRWRDRAGERCRFGLVPIASHGEWARRRPFETTTAVAASGRVAALTRARLAPQSAFAFWRAVPPVVRALHATPGLLLSLGIGESPIGLQGTFSVWESTAALQAFAYGTPEHRDVVRRTATERWYAESLFARFAVVESSGCYRGRAVA